VHGWSGVVLFGGPASVVETQSGRCVALMQDQKKMEFLLQGATVKVFSDVVVAPYEFTDDRGQKVSGETRKVSVLDSTRHIQEWRVADDVQLKIDTDYVVDLFINTGTATSGGKVTIVGAKPVGAAAPAAAARG